MTDNRQTEIRLCTAADAGQLFEVINDAAEAYRGVIPADRFHDPYMPLEHLESEIASGVVFWALDQDAVILGVMGIQDVDDVTLIRHAYVRTAERRRGIGARLLAHLTARADRPILIGTWKAATWAIDFYRKHGFEPVAEDQVPDLLRRYWSIPERQIETSVVLAERSTVGAEN
jgi:N-acetylglutamate synthase-like GNAT family acetyltransferase